MGDGILNPADICLLASLPEKEIISYRRKCGNLSCFYKHLFPCP